MAVVGWYCVLVACVVWRLEVVAEWFGFDQVTSSFASEESGESEEKDETREVLWRKSCFTPALVWSETGLNLPISLLVLPFCLVK